MINISKILSEPYFSESFLSKKSVIFQSSYTMDIEREVFCLKKREYFLLKSIIEEISEESMGWIKNFNISYLDSLNTKDLYDTLFVMMVYFYTDFPKMDIKVEIPDYFENLRDLFDIPVAQKLDRLNKFDLYPEFTNSLNEYLKDPCLDKICLSMRDLISDPKYRYKF